MRPTLLGFRAPDERTAEYNTQCLVNKEGTKYNILDETKQNPKGTNLPKANRFKEMPFYDRGSGQSIFTGPGSYNAIDAFSKLNVVPTPGIIKPIGVVEGKESGQQHYIMIGDQIKYEPGWVLNKDQKKNMKGLNVAGCTKPLSGVNRAKLVKNTKRAMTQSQQIKLHTKRRPQTPISPVKLLDDCQQQQQQLDSGKPVMIVNDIYSEPDNIENLNIKKMGSVAFSKPFTPLDSANPETRKPRMKSAVRYPTQQSTLFNLTDSKSGIITNSSLPRTATHIYSLKKGVYGSQSGVSSSNGNDQLTRAQSVPHSYTLQPNTPARGMGSLNQRAGSADFSENVDVKKIKGSICDLINLDYKAITPGKTSAKQQKSEHTKFITDTPLNDNYMNVIRESHFSVMSRHELQAERRKILELDPSQDSRMWNKIKSAMMRAQPQQPAATKLAQTTHATAQQSLNQRALSEINKRLDIMTHI